MIVEMGMISRPPERLQLIFTWSSIFPDHLGHISDVLKECVMDRRTNRPTNRWADALTDELGPPGEPQSRVSLGP